MRIEELFDENLNPLWDKIWQLEPFKACIGVNQNKEWHREMLEEHIRLVTVNMHGLISGNCPDWLVLKDEHKLMLMAAALCHDLGKATTTRWDEELQQWKCKNHGAVGERIVRKLFFDDPDIYLREAVCWLTRYHMTLHNAENQEQDVIEKKVEHISNPFPNVDFEDMLALYICDCMGCVNQRNDKHGFADDILFAHKCLELHEEIISNAGCKSSDFIPAIVMVGIAGSGKSTWAELFAKKNNYKIISRDSIREELGMVSKDKKFKGTKEQENKVSEVFNQRLLEYAQNKTSFIIDNTNLIERYRKDYKKLLENYRITWKCVYVEAPTIEDCKKRRNGMMPESEIDRMLDRLEFPRPYEFDEIELCKQND